MLSSVGVRAKVKVIKGEPTQKLIPQIKITRTK
jgi:hypothetical protein